MREKTPPPSTVFITRSRVKSESAGPGVGAPTTSATCFAPARCTKVRLGAAAVRTGCAGCVSGLGPPSNDLAIASRTNGAAKRPTTMTRVTLASQRRDPRVGNSAVWNVAAAMESRFDDGTPATASTSRERTIPASMPIAAGAKVLRTSTVRSMRSGRTVTVSVPPMCASESASGRPRVVGNPHASPVLT